MIEKTLEDIGLTKSEINVYLALLELGSSSTGKIVEKSQASSSKIYEILEKLMQKGLASFIVKSGVKHFEAAPPDRIMDYIKEKEQQLNKQKDGLVKIIPQLNLKRQLSKYKSEATVYKGIKGIETAFFNALKLLKSGDTVKSLAALNRSDTVNRMFVKFNKERAHRKIKMQIIFDEKARGQLRTKPMNQPLAERKFVPHATPASFDIFNDRVLIFPESEELILISIDSKEVAQAFNVQFEMWWNQDTTMVKGIDGIYRAWYKMLDELRSGDEYYVLGASWTGQKQEVPQRLIDFHEERKRRKIKAKFLFVSGTEELVKKHHSSYLVLSEVKFLPQAIYEGIQINLYENKVLIFVWREKEPVVFIIEDKNVFLTFKSYFDTLWNQNISVTTGMDKLRRILYSTMDEMDKGETWDVLGALMGVRSARTDYVDFFRALHKRRASKNIHGRLLFQPNIEFKPIDKYKKEFFEGNADYKDLPYDTGTPVAIFPRKNKTIMVIQEDEPTVITINNKQVSKSFQNHFEAMWNQDTRIVKGLEAIQEVFEEMLEAGSVDFIGARGYFVDKRPDWVEKWEKRAEKAGFKMRNIVDIETAGHRITKFPFAKTRYTIPKEFSKLSVFWIYGNKIVISNWTKDEPTAIHINSKELHDLYKEQFEALWNQDIYVMRGYDAIKHIFEEARLSGHVDTIGARGYLYNRDPDWVKAWSKRGIKSKFTMRHVCEKSTKGHAITKFPFAETKYNLPDGYSKLNAFWIFGKKVVIYNWTEEEPFALIIENPGLVEMYKQQFEVFWNKK